MRDKTVIKWLLDGKKIEEEIDNISDASASDHADFFDVSNIEEDDELPINDISIQMVQLCLHDFLEKISILKCISQKNFKPCSMNFPVYKTIEQRFGDVIDYGTEFYSEDKKRYTDLTTIYSVVYKALEDMTYHGHYNSLIKGTKILKQLYEDEEELIENEANSKTVELELQQKLSSQVKILENRYNEKLEELRKLELEYEDTIGYAHLEYKYIESWEASRRHQNMLVLQKQEFSYTDVNNTCAVQTQLEERVHSEIIRYCEQSSEDMQAEINYWLERYEEEIETRDNDLLKLRMEHEEQTEKHLKLKATYDERKEFIEQWYALMEQRRKAAELLTLQTFMATKIQAWWRMIMVLKKLGKFAKKKKNKAKDKDKAKAKKGAAGKKK